MTPATIDGGGVTSAPASSRSGVVGVASSVRSADRDVCADGRVTWSWSEVDAGVRRRRRGRVAWIGGWWSDSGPGDEYGWIESCCMLMQ